MAARPQVRLDEDVAEVLAPLAERQGTSIAVEANKALRARFGLPTHRPAAADAPQAQAQATARAATGRVGRQWTTPRGR